MNGDRLDQLLDASAPAAAEVAQAEFRAMITDARAEVVPDRPCAKKTALATGVLALLMLGGAGVATASGDWLWGEGLNNPDRSYTYTAPTWGQCEIRFSGYETPDVFIQADVNRIIDEWFATTDVEAAAAPFIDHHLDVLEASQTEQIASGEPTDPRLPDLNAWTAHEQALGEALHAELVAHGYDSEALAGSEAHSQLHCENEDWGGEGGEE
ncbi:hypothetical protein ACWGJP_12525 [Microbacterium sp. NPDC055903]